VHVAIRVSRCISTGSQLRKRPVAGSYRT
jgi:hypothetical protein